jgi:hypothetical protein
VLVFPFRLAREQEIEEGERTKGVARGLLDELGQRRRGVFHQRTQFC